MQFRLPGSPRYVGEVLAVQGGKVNVAPSRAGPRGRDEGGLEEGIYLAIVARTVEESRTGKAHLMRARIAEIGDDGNIVLEQSPEAAAHLSPGILLAVYAARSAAEKPLAIVPEFVPLKMEPEDPATGVPIPRSERLRLQALRHARLIGIAIHNYVDAYQRFPPATMHGPDGAAWHSWRVLLLPFMEQSGLYERYRFDEPWDGPNNHKLLAEMPAVYGDPVHGDNEERYTHFAAAVGNRKAFSPEGGTFDGKPASLMAAARRAGTRVTDFVDGSSNCILVGSVAPDRKIPWMKPEDIRVGEDFPRVGAEGGFAAPHELGNARAGIFLFADDSAHAVSSEIDAVMLGNLLTINDRNIVRPAALSAIRSQVDPLVVKYVERVDGVVAVLSVVRGAT